MYIVKRSEITYEIKAFKYHKIKRGLTGKRNFIFGFRIYG